MVSKYWDFLRSGFLAIRGEIVPFLKPPHFHQHQSTDTIVRRGIWTTSVIGKSPLSNYLIIN